MGNKLGKRRHVVDEKYTRPQGLYQHKDVDHKKLRKLIIESKLAPCYPGDEETTGDREECPICFLYYPTLNRSRCCMKSICTECFLQMKTPNSTRPTQCPFCKTSNYAVEYRGAKSKEEKGIEQVEEQRVIEAKIRIRQQELQDQEERTQKRLAVSSSGRMMETMDAEYGSTAVPSTRYSVEAGEIAASQDSCTATTVRQPPQSRQIRDDEFDLDLEDIMVMEAIWLSIQENGWHRNPAQGQAIPSEHVTGDRYVSSSAMAASAESSSSPSGGLACAIAALAERQQTGGESSTSRTGSTSAFNTLPGSNRISSWVEQDAENYSVGESSSEVAPNCSMAVTRDGDWSVDCGSEVAEAGTSYASSDAATVDAGGGMTALMPHDENESRFQNAPGHIVPESFEEQMMLAMAVSLAEARSTTSSQGVAWQ